MVDIMRREAIYLWYFFSIQFEQIVGYYALGIVLGSAISVFGKRRIHQLFVSLQKRGLGALGIIPACLIGIASPLCMYGTIPIAASFSQKGMKDDLLAAFMMGSILLNPQLIIYSAALGPTALAVRIASCFFCGIVAGLFIRIFFAKKEKSFFNFSGFGGQPNRAAAVLNRVDAHVSYADAAPDGDAALNCAAATGCDAPDYPDHSPVSDADTDPNLLLRLLKNLWRNIKATGPYFLIGVALSAAFQRYVPESIMVSLFGNNRAFGTLMAATIGVPLYVCGGGTIPLLQGWLASGMSMGSAAAFMITGPATKITNLGALKIVLGLKCFAFYLLFVVLFAFTTGIITDILIATP